MNYKRSIKELDQIRRFRNKGKKLFLNELESANSIDDLKRIIKHHVTVFFDEINFMYSLSGRSLQLISDVSKRNKEMSKSTEADDFSDGKVQKTMKGIVDEIQRFKEQKSRQKQSRGKKMVSDDFLDVERLRNTMK